MPCLFRKVKRLYSGVFRDPKMPKDDDLEMLKRRKLLELQRRMLRETQKPEELPARLAVRVHRAPSQGADDG